MIMNFKNTIKKVPHYNQHTTECIEFVRYMSFNLGNAFKYIWRAYDKGDPIENLEKAIYYLEDVHILSIFHQYYIDEIYLEVEKDLYLQFVNADLTFRSKNIEYSLLNIIMIQESYDFSTTKNIQHNLNKIKINLNNEINSIKTLQNNGKSP